MSMTVITDYDIEMSRGHSPCCLCNACATRRELERAESQAPNVEPSGTEKLDGLINQHWEWVQGLLIADTSDAERDWWEVCEYLYKTAFKHGWKHGQEELCKTYR